MAEDLVQDAFVWLVGRLRHLRKPEAFWTYLRGTIVNLATSHFRHRRVERAYLERQAAAPSATTNVNDELDEAMHRVVTQIIHSALDTKSPPGGRSGSARPSSRPRGTSA